MTLRNSLVWFRRDLRVDDHAALHHALLSSRRVFGVFVFDTDILAGLPSHDRRVQFLLDGVRELDARLRELGGYLIVRHGRAAQVIPELAAGLDAFPLAVVIHEEARTRTLARFRALPATP